MLHQADRLIRDLALHPHPEGGYYREIYRSAESIPASGLPPRFTGPRSFLTSIYFLLKHGELSALHRIQSDELWYFHKGDPLEIHAIEPDGRHQVHVLGPRLFQAMVPAGSWFGSRVAAGGHYALVGCAVAPGFDFADFEMGRQHDLLSLFPAHADIIRALTH